MQMSQLDRQDVELQSLRQNSQQSDEGRQSLQQEMQLRMDEINALSEDLANMTRENQVINTELMDTASERDSCRETLAAMEMRLGHAESSVATKDVEKEDIMGSYRKLHDTNVQLTATVREAEDNLARMRCGHRHYLAPTVLPRPRLNSSPCRRT
jgi:chromosome segregation ATPase